MNKQDGRKIKTKEHIEKIREAKKGTIITESAKKALIKRWSKDRAKRYKYLKKNCSKDFRTQYILRLMEQDMSESEIGRDMGLTKQRVSQILRDNCY